MTLYWHEGCITDFHGDTFTTLFFSYFAQKVAEGPLDPPPARSLSVLGIRMFSSTQEKRSDPYVSRLSQTKKKREDAVAKKGTSSKRQGGDNNCVPH